jgi:hypothetical protein
MPMAAHRVVVVPRPGLVAALMPAAHQELISTYFHTNRDVLSRHGVKQGVPSIPGKATIWIRKRSGVQHGSCGAVGASPLV